MAAKIAGAQEWAAEIATFTADVAGLAEAERGCCGFFRFTVTLDERGLALEVRGPSEAQQLVAALFGG